MSGGAEFGCESREPTRTHGMRIGVPLGRSRKPIELATLGDRAAGEASSGLLGDTDARDGVPTVPLIVYVILWLALNVFALMLWPPVFEASVVTPLSFAPPLIAYHLSRGSADARGWGLVFHVSVSIAATALAITHAVLSEVDPVVIAFAAGSWLIAALFLYRLRLPFVLTKGWALFLAVSAVFLGWTGFQAALEARGEFPQVELAAPAPWQSSDTPPKEADLSFFTEDSTLVAFGERNGVSWAIYTYSSNSGPEKCLAFTENSRLLAGSCPLNFVAPDHVMGLSYSEGESGNIIKGVVSKSVRGLELRFEGGGIQPIRIVEPPPEAGLDVNVYFAFIPDGVGPESYGISAFNAEGERIDRLGSWDTL